MKKAIFWFCALILGLSTITFLPLKAHAATHTVPGDYATIQAALDDAGVVAGDTILVAGGTTYHETLILPGKSNLTLAGAGAQTTIISSALGAAITSNSGDQNVTIEGFTITSTDNNGLECNGFDTPSQLIITNNIFNGSDGNGIHVDGDCELNINNNTISDNGISGIGMLDNSLTNTIWNNTITDNFYEGIYLTEADSANNSIYGNTLTGNAFGIYLDESIASIHNNNIHNNGTVETDDPGAGISAGFSTVQIYANKIYQNSNPNDDGGGIAVGMAGVGSNIFNNYIAQNDAYGVGGGIFSLDDSTPIYNNTIVNNTAQGHFLDGEGGGQQSKNKAIASSDPALQEKIDSILAQVKNPWGNVHINFGPGNYGGGVAIAHNPAPAPALYNNIIWGSDDILDADSDLVVNYSDLQEPWTGAGSNNKSSDPKLTGYVLGTGSPCIDAGMSTGAPNMDIDGTSRPQGTGYDIGAYELKVVLPETGGHSNNQNFILILIAILSAALILIVTKRIIIKR